jgi:adenylate cyclase
MAHLTVEAADGTKQRIRVDRASFSIGYALDNDLQLDDDEISAHHARLVRGPHGYAISALSDTSSLHVNGRAEEGCLLRTGDEIRLGTTRLVFEYTEEDAFQPSGRGEVPPRTGLPGDLADALGEERNARRFELLYRVGRKVLSAHSIEEVTDLALPLFFECVNAERGALLLKDRATGELEPRVLGHRDGTRLDANEMRVPTSIVAAAVTERVGVLTSDALSDQRFETKSSVRLSGIHSALCAPLRDGDEVLGVIYLDSRIQTHVFGQTDLVLASAIANLIAIRLRQDALFEQLATERVERAVLERYHSPDVAEAILRQAHDTGAPVNGLEEREVTVLFADIEGSTLLAEALPPSVLAEFLSEYYELTTRVIFAHGGSVNEFVGDSAMAIFGAPVPHADHADRAVKAGLSILTALAAGSEGLLVRFGVRVRIAVSSGRVMVGTVGPANRLKYAVMGDAVNVAARLERLGEPNSLTIGEETLRRLSDPSGFEDLGPIKLRGRDKPVRVYRRHVPLPQTS